MTSVAQIPRARANQRLASWAAYGIGPFAIAALWWLRRDGMIANTPLWVVAAMLVVGGSANFATTLWSRHSPHSRPAIHARVAASTLLTAGIIYSTGWGALLIVAFALGSAEILRTVGPTTSRPNLIWNWIAIGAGELAVHFGLAPSAVSIRVSHAIALAGAICLALVTKVLGDSAEATETAELMVRDRARRFESLIEHAADLIGVIALDGTIVSASPAVEPMLGLTVDDLTGRSITEFMAPRDAELVESVLAEVATQIGQASVFELRLHHRDGTDRLVIATLVRPTADWSGELVVNIHDITTQRELEERLRHDARHDALTGLLNRKAFGEASERACARAARQHRTVGMLYIDLDGFKEINDSFGHDKGDQVLIETSRRLTRCLGSGETLARLGGDEFAVLINAVGDTDAIALSEQILLELSQPIPGLPASARVGASIGIALRSSEGIEISNLMREADEAMYTAKRNGRARWEMSVTDR